MLFSQSVSTVLPAIRGQDLRPCRRLVLNQWSAVQLLVVILIGVLLCLKRLDIFSMNEVRAFVSVIFGFAVSCLVLSFIWIIQRKPVNSVCSSSDYNLSGIPNMHPEGRSNSVSSDQARNRGETVCTISSSVDPPPGYEDALISSKPVSSDYLNPKKHSISQTDIDWFDHSVCSKHPNLTVQPSMVASNAPPFCRACFDELIYNVVGRKRSTGNSMAQSALKIKHSSSSGEQLFNRGKTVQMENRCGEQRFRRISAYHPPQDYGQDEAVERGPRKVSFYQLDANQLMPGESPPKYDEISVLREQYEYDKLDNVNPATSTRL